MTSKHFRGLWLSLFSLAWLSLTFWVAIAFGQPLTGESAGPRPTSSLQGATQEPPSHPTVWHRLRIGLHEVVGRPIRTDIAEVRAALAPMGVLDWHKQGRTGKRIKVAVLDSGFRGYRAAQGKALPATVLARSFRKDGQLEARDSMHGILCGEVIHHIAPDAELLLANWEPEQPDSFLDAVRWARSQGAKVISCSVIMPTWSDGEGGGDVHEQIRRALGAGNQAGDGLFVASAGNTALRSWAGAYNPGPGGWHQWARGKADNSIKPLSNERISVEVVNKGEDAYEAVVLDTTSKQEVARAKSHLVEGSMACAARFEPHSGHRYAVKLRLLDETKGKAGRFHMTVLGGKLGLANRAESIPFPADGAEVMAIGATDDRGRREAYSSCGPVAGSLKPDLSAVVPFPSLWRSQQPFSGTSAAAPQAAGLAALLWSAHPDWSADQVREALAQAARKPGTSHSTETGHGSVRLPAN